MPQKAERPHAPLAAQTEAFADSVDAKRFVEVLERKDYRRMATGKEVPLGLMEYCVPDPKTVKYYPAGREDERRLRISASNIRLTTGRPRQQKRLRDDPPAAAARPRTAPIAGPADILAHAQPRPEGLMLPDLTDEDRDAIMDEAPGPVVVRLPGRGLERHGTDADAADAVRGVRIELEDQLKRLEEDVAVLRAAEDMLRRLAKDRAATESETSAGLGAPRSGAPSGP